MKQLIFSFNDKKISKLKNKKNILGGKGANLGEMGDWVYQFLQDLLFQPKFVIYSIKTKKNYQKI